MFVILQKYYYSRYKAQWLNIYIIHSQLDTRTVYQVLEF